MQIAQRIALAGLLIAGVIHLGIAPEHYTHAPAHGLCFGLIGLAQIGWVLLAWRRPHLPLFWPGVALSGGVITLWLLAHGLRTPFADATHPLDWAAFTSKAAESTTLVALLYLRRLHVPGTNPAALLARACVLSVSIGGVMWGSGLALAPRFPQLAHTHSGHDHAGHTHAVQSQAGFAGAPASTEDTYDWRLPPGFPPPYVPPDNPMTAERVELGRYLFYDVRLSANETTSCATCHRQELAFTDGRATAVGSTGQTHPRNAQGLANVAYLSTLTWANPTLTQLERQILVPMFGEFPVEMGITGHEDKVLARFQNDVRYRQMFVAAFPDESDPIQWNNIVKALASFNRALISGNAPYDHYTAQGDTTALSPSAARGMHLFLSEGLECHHCHGGFNFTGSTRQRNTVFVETPFHNTGLYNLDGAGAYPRGNTGLHEVTGKTEDMGRFRAPSLRNVELTAPYMHDGSVATLEEIIRLYEKGGRHIRSGPNAGDGRRNPHKSGFVPGFTLTDQERQDLINFLHSLTDEQFIADPRFSDPFVGDQ